MRIGLVYDVFDAYPWREGDPPDADAEYEPTETVIALAAAVRRLGHQPIPIGTAHDLLAYAADRDCRGLDAAISIAEGAHGRNREGYAPTLFEMIGLPYLGSDALTLSLSLDKAWTKDLAAAAAVPTPPYRAYASADAIDEADLPGDFPFFVKPRYEGSSKGITTRSKVSSLSALRSQVERLVAQYRQDALVEPFVQGGGEFTVAVIGSARPGAEPEALPVLQRAVEERSGIGLHALERRGRPARDWGHRLEGELSPELEAELSRLALRVFQKLRCHDFARADFRIDEAGRPWFLEINPLPTFAPDGTFAIIAELLGQPYEAFLADVLERGFRRLGLTLSS
ncbi:MAG: D-alanine--D-alanine ligase family protein [Rhodothermales bacterium]